MSAILGHVPLGDRDTARAVAFYNAVLGELGITRDKSGDGFVGWGSPHGCRCGYCRRRATICRRFHAVGQGRFRGCS
jgi:hypothetical protein